MANPQAVLNERSLVSLSKNDCESNLSDLFSFINELKSEHNTSLIYPENIYDLQVSEDHAFIDLLYGQSPLSRDTCGLIQKILDRSNSHSCEAKPLTLNLGEAEKIIQGIGLTIAFDSQETHDSCFCCGLKKEPFQNQLLKLSDGNQCFDIFHIQSNETFRDYMRTLPEKNNWSWEQLWENAPLLFPNLIFHDGVKNTVKGLSKPIREILPIVVTHLAAINDHYLSCMEEAKGDVQKISTFFKSAYGVDISPESPNTRGSRKMTDREFTYKGKTHVCEWHSKIFPHLDRIHFCPYSEDKILIGHIGKHLPT